MKKIVVASRNAGKIREFKTMLEPEGYEVLSLLDLPDAEDPEENGSTFAENAVIKAEAVVRQYGLEAIADDSGLEVDALNGEPGIYSARWLGHDTSYEYKNQVILDRVKDAETRACRYVAAIAWMKPGEEPKVFVDTCECVIADHPAGHNGFGYDPIIFYEPMGKTMAEMSDEEKNSISHRAKALRRLEAWLNEKK